MPYRDIDVRHHAIWREDDWAVVFYTDANLPPSLREALEHELGPDHTLMITPIPDGQEIVIWSRCTLNCALQFALEALEDAILTFCLLFPGKDPAFKVTHSMVLPIEEWRVARCADSVIPGQ